MLKRKDVHEPLLRGWRFGLRVPIEHAMCGTSSALVIERALHVLAAWRAWKPNYGPVKMARLKRENAVSDAQISDIGTREDNQTSDT